MGLINSSLCRNDFGRLGEIAIDDFKGESNCCVALPAPTDNGAPYAPG